MSFEISIKMSDPPYASAPIHRPAGNVTGAAALEPPGGPHTTVIGIPHTNSIESNKSGRVPSIANGGASSGMSNRPIFNKVFFCKKWNYAFSKSSENKGSNA